MGAQKGPHSSLPVGVFTSSYLVNVNLSRGAPPFFSGPSRPSGLPRLWRCSLDRHYSDRKKASRSALWMAGRLKNRFRT